MKIKTVETLSVVHHKRGILAREPNPKRGMGQKQLDHQLPGGSVAILNKWFQFLVLYYQFGTLVSAGKTTSHFAWIANYFCKQIFWSVILLSVKNGLMQNFTASSCVDFQWFWAKSELAQLPDMPSGVKIHIMFLVNSPNQASGWDWIWRCIQSCVHLFFSPYDYRMFPLWCLLWWVIQYCKTILPYLSISITKWMVCTVGCWVAFLGRSQG